MEQRQQFLICHEKDSTGAVQQDTLLRDASSFFCLNWKILLFITFILLTSGITMSIVSDVSDDR